MEPLADVSGWQCPPERRCRTCAIGYCRFRNEERTDENTLCLSCCIRKEIYLKSKLVFPRSFRKSMDEKNDWPFKLVDPIDGEEVVSNSPIKSAVMQKIDKFERENVGVIVEYTEDGSVIAPSNRRAETKDPYAVLPARRGVRVCFRYVYSSRIELIHQ